MLLLKSTEGKHDVANQTKTTAMVLIGMQTERELVKLGQGRGHRTGIWGGKTMTGTWDWDIEGKAGMGT